MAYAAVLSLNQTLEQISNPHPGRPEQYKTPLEDQQIKSLQEKLNSLLEFMDHSWQRRSEELRCLEREFQDAAYKVVDMIDLHISKNFGQEGFQERQMRDQTFLENFEIVAEEIDSIKKKADKLKELCTDLHQSQRTSSPAGSSRPTSSGKNDMVGFQNDLDQIKGQLTGNKATLQIIQVTGMGGIGKTTLATNVYNDPLIEYHFHIRAWVSISQEYREREVLLSLLDSMKQLNAEMRQEMDNENLKEYLFKSLKGRRYLVVMDDVWNSKAWDSLRRIFPDDRNGSRIMFTARLSLTIDSHSSPHQMQFLNKTDSWKLLRRKVFGEDFCPLELEESGKMIAKNCRGLPLSLVVMGGHLSKANRTKDHWECIAKDVKSVVTATEENCLEILSLSYDYLPHHLKAFFLYVGIFPEDAKIRVSQLIKLWAAEGFLKPVRSKILEEVAEEYLGDLISRNLIMSNEKSSRGKIKTCSIHDLLRDLCIRKAQEEKFFHVTDKDFNIFAEGMKYSRRLCIPPNIVLKESPNGDNSNVNPSMGSLPPIRSVLCSGFSCEIYDLGEGKLFPLLRVLDLAKRKVDGFPIGETKLVHLRCLSFSSDRKISIAKTLRDTLWNLQTLIVDCDEVHLPEEIWRMPQLRHLLFGVCYLPCPAKSPIDGENLVLGNLLTLSKVTSSSCTKELLERVPNLNKLGIWIELCEFMPFSLVNLLQLENLKIISIYGTKMNFEFPPNIRKLTLQQCNIPWEHMTIVGSMPNLEVLKLRHEAFVGPEWKPTEGEFCKLKYLLLYCIDLVQWRVDDTQFTSLECLVLRRCFKLKEIPCSFGSISTLQTIDLDDASPSAVTSAKQIQEEQKEGGNDSLHVSVFDVFHSSRQLIEDPEAEIIPKLLSSDNTLQLEATNQFLGIVLDDSISPVEEVLSVVIPRLLEFLQRDDYPQLQMKAIHAIERLSFHSSDNINMLIDQYGAIPILVNLISSPNDDLCEQALVVLQRFIRDSTKSCDHVLSYGVLTPLLTQFDDKTKLSIMRHAARTLCYLCAGNPEPEFEQLKPSLLPLANLIHKDDVQVLNYACFAMLHLFTNKTEVMIQAAIDAGVFPRLVELLQYPSKTVWYPALGVVCKIIQYVDDIQIQVITNNWALLYLHNLLTQDYDKVIKHWTIKVISEIIKRSKDNFQAVIEAGIISPLVQLLQNDEFDIQVLAALSLSLMTKGTNEQIKFLVQEGCIKPMCDFLLRPNKEVIIVLLGLMNILEVGEAEKNTEDVNVFAQMIDDAGGVQNMKNLQTHDDGKIWEMAVNVLKAYLQEENDE